MIRKPEGLFTAKSIGAPNVRHGGIHRLPPLRGGRPASSLRAHFSIPKRCFCASLNDIDSVVLLLLPVFCCFLCSYSEALGAVGGAEIPSLGK